MRDIIAANLEILLESHAIKMTHTSKRIRKSSSMMLVIFPPQVKAAEKWLCYMCSSDHSKVGLLTKREDWVHKLRELFMNDHEMDYVSSSCA